METKSSLTVLMAHYGNEFWLEGAVWLWRKAGATNFLISYPEDLIDQRACELILDRLRTKNHDASVRLIGVPESTRNHASFSHAEAIFALRTALADAPTEIVAVADPDCWPIAPANMRLAIQAVSSSGIPMLAADNLRPTLGHPCTVLVPSNLFFTLDLFVGMAGFEFDFARLWNRELGIASGSLMQPIQLGTKGEFFYPNFGTLHFASQAFLGSKWVSASILPWRRYSMFYELRKAKRILRKWRDEFDGDQEMVLKASRYLKT